MLNMYHGRSPVLYHTDTEGNPSQKGGIEMTMDVMTPQAEVRGSVVDGDAYLHEGERQEAAIPPLPRSIRAR